MRSYRWQQIPRLVRSKSGRRRLRNSIIYRLRGILIPLARLYRRTLIRHVKVVTVIGSFGKTTTTRAIATALDLSPEKYQGDNSGVFLAASLLSIPPWARLHVMEVGISEKGQMEKNAALIRPDIVVVTCIGSEHRLSLGNLSQTREEKARMVRALPENGVAVLNGDDDHVLKMGSYTKAKIITHGYDDKNDFKASLISTDLTNGTLFSVIFNSEYHEISTKLFGKASMRSLMAAIIVSKELGVDTRVALQRLRTIKPVHQRLEVINTTNGAYILLDTLKSAIETVELALETLEDLPVKRKIVILGEVEERPGSIGEVYRAIGDRVARIATHMVFLGTKRVKRPLFAEMKRKGMSNENILFAEQSVNKAKELALQLVQPGDLVLIKGRSSQKLERIALALMGETVSCNLEFCRQKMRCTSCLNLHKDPASCTNKEILDAKEKSIFNKGDNDNLVNPGWFT